jgi:hypothetical protein
LETQVTNSHSHTPNDIGKTVLSLGAIFAVVFAFWQIQNSVREDIRPELVELRSDIRKIEEKVNLMIGQQDIIVRRLNLVK